MKKFYSFLALLMCTLFGFSASAQETDSKAALFVKGDFYFATLQNDANNRVEASVYKDDAAEGKYVTLDFNAEENLFNIKSQNEAKSFFVYKNGEVVENSEAGVQQEMFNAQTTLKDGDVVKVYSAKPYTTNMNLGFMNGSADQVEVIMDKVQTVAADGNVKVLEGTEFQIKATEGNEIEAVYYCNEDVAGVDGVYTITADREGDALIIIDMKQAVATGTASVKIMGRFLNVAAQNEEESDPRLAELFQYNAETGIDKTEQIDIVGEMQVRLIAQAEDNAIYVTLDGQPVASETDGMFDKVLTLKPGSEVVVLNAEPSTGVATVNINGNFWNVTAQDVNIFAPRAAEIFSFQPEDGIIDETVEVSVNETKTIRLIAQNEKNEVYVTLNGQPVASKQASMYEAEIVLRAGDMLNITNAEPAAGVATVTINGNFFNVNAQDVNITDPRAAEVFAFTPGGEAINETVEVPVDGTKTIRLTVQAENNEVYVTLDGQKVASSQEGMFQAEITLRAGSVLNIVNVEPSTGYAIININGNFFNVTAQDVNISDPRAAEVFSFQPEDGTISKTIELQVNGTKTIKLTAQNEDNTVYVTLDGQKVASSQEGLFQAEITLRAGSILNIINAEPSTGVATVNINGNFRNVTAQDVNVSDPRAAEVFSFQPEDGIINESVEVSVDGTMTIRLTAQNENNEVYVTLNGEKVASSQDGMFQAEITLRAGDVLDITDAEPSTGYATVSISGNFWNVTAQDVNISDPRGAEVFSFQPEDGVLYQNVEVKVNGTKTIRLTAQNENNEIYVALNGQKIASSQEGMFQAEITLRAGDVITIANTEPATGVATVNINGTFYTFSAQNVNTSDPRAAELFSVNGEVDVTKEIAVDVEMTVRLVGQAENNAIYVELDGQPVASEQEFMFDATVTLKAGSVLNIMNAAPATGVATVNINGTFYTFSAQNVNASDPRAAELFSVNGEVDVTKEIAVDGEMTVRLVGQAENNAIYVTLNGQPVASEQEFMFQATVTLQAGDVLNIQNAAPATGVATVSINGTFWNVTAQDVNIDDPRAAEVFSFQPEAGETEIKKTVNVAVDDTKTIKLTVQNEENKVYVALNGQKVESVMDGMFQAEITLQAGDTLDITNDYTTGINAVTTANSSKAYNLQGVEVKNPVKGLFIIGGKKVLVK